MSKVWWMSICMYTRKDVFFRFIFSKLRSKWKDWPLQIVLLHCIPLSRLPKTEWKKIMKMTVFLFSKFICLFPSFLVLYRDKFPHTLSSLKRLTIAAENCLLNKDPTQNKDENVVNVVFYTVERSKWCTGRCSRRMNKLKPDSISHSIMQIRT